MDHIQFLASEKERAILPVRGVDSRTFTFFATFESIVEARKAEKRSSVEDESISDDEGSYCKTSISGSGV